MMVELGERLYFSAGSDKNIKLTFMIDGSRIPGAAAVGVNRIIQIVPAKKSIICVCHYPNFFAEPF